MPTPFEYVKSVSHTKKEMMRDENGGVRYDSDEYIPYLTNKSLSYFPDTILHANLINEYPDLPKDAQYRYYLNTLRPRNRFKKWSKPQNAELLGRVMEYFQCGERTAKEYLRYLPSHKIEYIIETTEKGGK